MSDIIDTLQNQGMADAQTIANECRGETVDTVTDALNNAESAEYSRDEGMWIYTAGV